MGSFRELSCLVFRIGESKFLLVKMTGKGGGGSFLINVTNQTVFRRLHLTTVSCCKSAVPFPEDARVLIDNC